MNKELKPLIYKLTWLGIFAVSMAYLESAVVVYLRELYYPGGFEFPIKLIPAKMAIIEIGREAATIFMLIAVAFIAGRKRSARWAYFMFCFGIWDIWYYIWLKVFLNWPGSFLTWDLLFLIPVPWVAPVLAPVIVSLSLIIAAIVILHLENNGILFQLIKIEWAILVIAGLLIFVSFVLDTSRIMNYEAPFYYHWELFVLGEIIGIAVYIRAIRNLKKK